MPAIYGLNLVDLDETIADSRYLLAQRSAAGKNRTLRPAVYAEISKMQAIPEMVTLITDLKSHGGQVEIVTNSWSEYAAHVCRHLDLLPIHIQAAASKPNPDKLVERVAAFRAKYPQGKVIHIGDSVKDLEASIRARIGFIFCQWGELNGTAFMPSRHEAPWIVAQVTTPAQLRQHLII